MRFQFVKTVNTLLVLGCLLQFSSHAGTVRISFLRDDAQLRQTAEFLQESGCKAEAISVFKRAVRHYYSTEFALDLTGFPKIQDGFYVFFSPQDLVSALPHALSNTPHAYEINCFDIAIILTADQLKIGLRPDEVSGQFFFSKLTTNGVVHGKATTAQDAFTQKVPPWYLEATKDIIPEAMADARVCLTSALFANHWLPRSANEEKLGAGVMEALRASWRQRGIKFPQAFDVVLCHEVNFPRWGFGTTHAGLLIRRDKGYTYIEKAGGSGPFVRLDLDDEADLLPWLAALFKGLEHEYTHLFATFNDTKIEKLQTPK